MHSSDDITLSEAIRRVIHNRRRVFTLGLSGLLLGVVIALVSRPVYVSEVLVVPSGTGSAGQAEGLARNFAGLASLAGVDLSSQSSSNRDIALATISSYQTVANFIKSRTLMDRVLE